MGQILEGGSVSVGGVGQGIFDVLAGEPIAKGDLVEFGYNGKAYKARVTDYAAVANITYGTANSGQIVAQTQLVASQTLASYRQAVVQGGDGSIYTLNNSSTAGGMFLSKYSVAGSLVVSVDAYAGAPCEGQRMVRLSNGNIAIFAFRTDNSTSAFAVYDSNLNVVSNVAQWGDASVLNAFFDVCALSGGGFAIVYQSASTPLASKLVIYNNSGNAVLAATTIWTRTGTSGTQYHRIAQLSSGDLIVVANSANTVSSIGLFHGIVTTSGVSVKEFTNLNSVSGSNAIPELSVMNGFYAISHQTGSFQAAFIFANTGTQQGSTFSAETTITSQLYMKLVNDGSANFYLIWPRSSDSKEVITKLPITGTGYVTSIVTSAAFSNYNTPFDAFLEGSVICLFYLGSNASCLLVINTDSLTLIADRTVIGTTVAAEGSRPRCIPAGDFSFIAMWDVLNSPATNFYVGKYANTAVVGVAQGAAAAGATVPVASPAGGYATNYLKGTVSKTFDHSAANIMGNKGVLMNYGAVLKGF